MQEEKEPAPKTQRSRWIITHNAARMALIVAIVLGAPVALQVLRRQVPVGAFLVVLGVVVAALAVVALTDRRQR